VALFCQSLLHLQQQDFSAVRPLTLLLKCMLKQRGLSEVYMGGLGSWSLVNMVIAHLMVRVAGMCLLLLAPIAVDGAALVVGCSRQL
jgi:DNA polymerase sigma